MLFEKMDVVSYRLPNGLNATGIVRGIHAHGYLDVEVWYGTYSAPASDFTLVNRPTVVW